jgi:hypothetical protein
LPRSPKGARTGKKANFLLFWAKKEKQKTAKVAKVRIGINRSLFV